MRAILFTLVAFIAITATLSGLMMISDPGGGILHLNPGLLDGTPFRDYLVPGILLFAVVGCVNIIAIYAILSGSANRYLWSGAGGVLITGWILVQVIMLQLALWLHFVYFISGVLIILISYHLRRKWAV